MSGLHTSLLERVSKGDESALSDLYDATASDVHGLAMRMLADPESAQQATLDLFHRVWAEASSYCSDRGSVLAWLLCMTRSRCLDELRKRRRRLQDRSIACLASVPATEPGPSDLAVRDERRESVRRALGRLKPEQRQAIEVAFFDGLSHQEIAQHLQQPLGTIKARIRTGMSRLRELLAHSQRADA